MKQGWLVFLTMVICMSILVIAFLWGYGFEKAAPGESVEISEQRATNKQKVNLYFTNKDKSKILSESREVSSRNEESLLRIVMQELLKGPVNIEMKRAIPEETKLIDIKREGTVAIVNFSDEYHGTNGSIGEILARFTVVNTLCELPNIQKVKILVDGKELVGPDRQPFGVLGKDDVVFKAPPDEKNKTIIKLYFSGKNAEYLVGEEREVVVKDANLEKYIIQELIKGPTDKELSKTVPPETKLISIETKDGTCFVNLSQEFKTKHWGGSTGEMLTIYSIVSSLTELPHIQKVQFLIEGQKLEVFEHMIFNEPFIRDPSLIKMGS